MGRFKLGIIVVLLFAVLIFGIYYALIPEYSVYKIFSSEGANFRETDLYIIVNKPWNIEKTVQKSVDQYRKMNGTPNRLKVQLYHNKRDVDIGREFHKVMFEYGEDEVREPPGVWND